MTGQPQRVLVLNAGSSSLKFQLVEPGTAHVVAKGLAERVGDSGSSVTAIVDGRDHHHDREIPDPEAALKAMQDVLAEAGVDLQHSGVVAVGHRVVHGGRRLTEPTVVDDDVLAEIDRVATLAPLHNPGNAAGIRSARKVFPDLPQVAVFDTAFFSDLPEAASTYAIDRGLATEHALKRYGAHGTSHRYVSGRVPEVLGRDAGDLRQIVLHLGNGASASAVRDGRAVETSMGLTPLEGLVMGTRGGDVDPGVLLHLHRVAGLDVEEIDHLLNKQSGLLGLAGTGDFRDVLAAMDGGDADARRAFEVYVHRLRKYVGAYAAVLGRLDVITFTAGVGENNARVRAAALEGLDELLGVRLDPARNDSADRGERVISADDSRVTVLVVPTDEELAIAREAVALI